MNHSLRIGIQVLAGALFLAGAARGHAAGELAALDAACSPPTDMPAIPDGATASQSEMLAAQAAVRQFDATVAGYTKCLADAARQAAASEPASAEAMELARIERNNAAVALAEGRVAKFNSEVRKFRGDEPVAIEEGLELPVVKAERGEIAEAAAKCRKPGQNAGGKVGLFVTVRRTGGVEAVRRGASSGNAEVDDLAVCIARRLVFKPARQHGEAITLFDVPITLDVPALD